MTCVNIKKYIMIIIICNTVTCQVDEYYGYPGGVGFSGLIESVDNVKIKNNRNSSSKACTSCQTAISTSRNLELVRQLNELESYEDFFNFLERTPGEGRDKLAAVRYARENERSVKKTFRHGRCQPTLQVISTSQNSTHSFYPSCVRLLRCGGCCNDPLWSCQAIETVKVSIELFIHSNYKSYENFLGNHNILMEEHTNCQCKCVNSQKDCLPEQILDETSCKCQCAASIKKECEKDFPRKNFNSETCKCECAKNTPCNTRQRMDLDTCRCVSLVKENSTDVRESPSENNTHTQRVITQKPINTVGIADPRRRHKDEP